MLPSFGGMLAPRGSPLLPHFFCLGLMMDKKGLGIYDHFLWKGKQRGHINISISGNPSCREQLREA